MVDTVKGPVHGKIIHSVTDTTVNTATPITPSPFIQPVSLLTKIDELIERVDAKIMADEAKAKSVFKTYWPVAVALVVGVVIGVGLARFL